MKFQKKLILVSLSHFRMEIKVLSYWSVNEYDNATALSDAVCSSLVFNNTYEQKFNVCFYAKVYTLRVLTLYQPLSVIMKCGTGFLTSVMENVSINVAFMVSCIVYRRIRTCCNIIALLNIIYDEQILNDLKLNTIYMCDGTVKTIQKEKTMKFKLHYTNKDHWNYCYETAKDNCQ
ncbi:hypothetical protein T05_13533 [Trichinella murrelli]|uniref:Uncharacterized protein n=1 Tax=Trichinella murrelli TaxID=144512 RepID=A0A0V0TC16_9BILA|nr:hypothetical protein T05_13533 [Trichinella murrelli]